MAGPERKTRADERQGEEDHRLPRGRSRARGARAARTPTRCTRSRSCRAAGRSATRMQLPTEDKYLPDPLARCSTSSPYCSAAAPPRSSSSTSPTTGAGNDIEKATAIARAMVTAVRHERQARRAEVRRATPARCSSAATWATSATTPRTIAGEIDDEVRGADRGRARRGVGGARRVPRRAGRPGPRLMDKETLARTRCSRSSPRTEAAGPRLLHRHRQAVSVRPSAGADPPSWARRVRVADCSNGRQRSPLQVPAREPDEAGGRSRPGCRHRPRSARVRHGRPASRRAALRRMPRGTTGDPVTADDERTRRGNGRRSCPPSSSAPAGWVGQTRGRAPPFDRRAEAPCASCCRGRRGPRPRRPAQHPRPGRPGLRGAFAGLRPDPAEVLTTIFDEGHDEMVLVRTSSSTRLCEHHLVPFHGRRTSATSRTTTARSPGCRSWPAWSTSTPAGRRCRSG